MFIYFYFFLFSEELILNAKYNTTYANGAGGVYLNWTINDQEKNQTDYYKIYLETKSGWEPVSTHKWGTTINVLNIYPSNSINGTALININECKPFLTNEKVYMSFKSGSKSNYPKSASLKVWMEGGYIENDNYDACGADSNGEQIINVTLKSIDDFEKELENSNQTWLYHFDVTAFGFWDYSDCYSIKTETAEGVISDYIKKGYGFITGHDSITSGFEDNENNAEGIVAIRKLFNVTVKDHDKDYFNYIESDKIEVHKQGLLLMYPWNLINRGEEDESINFSHTSHHKAHGDIWFSFASTPEYDTTKCNETDNFYLTTFGNTAMVQTGHTGSATSFERKILANTIFYLKQRTNETEFEDHYLNLPDTSQPEINDIVIDQANYLITIEANVGTQYTFKVVAYNGTGQSINESEVVVNVTKGIAHYNYTFSANANCELHDLTNITYENTIKFTTNDVVDQMYLHVAPTDNKNITGNITTVRLNFSTNTFSQSNTYSQSNTFTQSNSFSESNTFSQSNTFSESNTFTKSNSFTDSNSFSESNSFTSSFPFGASLSFSFILTIYSSDISSFTQIFRTQYLSDSTLIFYEYSIIHMTTIISFYSDYYTFVFQSLYRISDEPVLNSVSLIGIICGSIALVLIIIGVMVWLFRISKKDKSDSELNGKFSDSLSSNLEKEQQYEMIQTIGEMAKEDDDQWM